jgi:hypothetical protein
MAPRSRRDKDMTDHKAIKQTIRVFPMEKKKVTVTFFNEDAIFTIAKR